MLVNFTKAPLDNQITARGAEEAEVVHLVLVAARVEEGRDADELAWWSVRW